MRRAIGAFVVLGLIGGAVWIGTTAVGPRFLPSDVATPMVEKINENRFRVWPASAPVEMDQTYIYETGHCGLAYDLDFDGSFWRAINPNGTQGPPSFFINYDRGYITLVSEDVAQYASPEGEIVELRRIDGPIVIGNCA